MSAEKENKEKEKTVVKKNPAAPAAAPAAPAAEAPVKIKKKATRVSPMGVAHIKSTFNNTIITITDIQGNAINWSSSGVAGFKGTKKGTPFAAQSAAELVGRSALDKGVKEIDVYVKGPGPGRETAIRTLQSVGLTINTIKDVTPIPHDGCRPRKRRRV